MSRIGVGLVMVVGVVVGLVAAPASAVAQTTAGAYFELPSFHFGDADDCTSPNPEPQLNAPVVATTVTPDNGGIWQAAADGGVFTCGDAGFYGSAASESLVAPIVAMTATPNGRGYWVAAADGGVFSYGDAAFFGSAATFSHASIVGIVSTPDGGGYWLAAADGGVFSFGDARFYGAAASFRLAQPVVGMARSADSGGYWLATADGGVFSFGDARFYGSAASFGLNAPITGIAASLNGGGYWLSGADGGVFAFGNASFYGSSSGFGVWPDPVGGITAIPGGGGYVLFLSPPAYDESNPTGMSGFYLARQNYVGNNYYSAALHSLFLDQAALYLQMGETLDSDGPQKPSYSAAINELQQLAVIPNMVTSAQAAESVRLTTELDTFFGVPGFDQG
jgi:hypothetical protein